MKLFSLLLCVLGTAHGFRLGVVPRCRMPLHMKMNQGLSKAVAGIFTGLALSTSPQIISSTVPISIVPPAEAAKSLNAATGGGSRVNKDPESLLRYGLPIQSKEAREIQAEIEGIRDFFRIKQFDSAISSADRAQSRLSSSKTKLLQAVRPSKKKDAEALITQMIADLDPVKETLRLDARTGTVQEREKLDKAYTEQDKVAQEIGKLEEMMIPEGYAVPVPEEYQNLPILRGRAKVEMILEKQGGEAFDLDGQLYKQAKLTMVLDGYNAPVTAGNILDLIKKGFYNGMEINRSDGFVVQTGDPKGDADGYIPAGQAEPRTIPLEIFVEGDTEPMYGSTTEEDGRGYAQSVLKFQSYGALGMARTEFENNSGSSQFFWLLFESDLTPAGKNLLDGRYACFGYTIQGAEFLKDVREGDIIKSAKILDGAENLVV